MFNIGIAMLKLLVAVTFIVGVGFVVVWVCGSIGIPLPPMLVKIAEIILGLLVIIALAQIVRSGGGDGTAGSLFKW